MNQNPYFRVERPRLCAFDAIPLQDGDVSEILDCQSYTTNNIYIFGFLTSAGKITLQKSCDSITFENTDFSQEAIGSFGFECGVQPYLFVRLLYTSFVETPNLIVAFIATC